MKKLLNRVTWVFLFAGSFPELKRKYINDLDTLYRCVERLSLRYVNVME